MVANHEIIHFALLGAIPLVYYTKREHNCEAFTECDNLVYQFFFIHLWCCIAKGCGYLCVFYEQYELSNLFEISRLPVYLLFIFQAHFVEL